MIAQLILLASIALTMVIAAPAASAQTLAPDQVDTLKTVIWASINNHHPGDGTSDFKGSFDWHSDVHAHWALLSIARVTNDSDLEQKMLSILTLDRLQKEHDFLMSQGWQSFEKPYGRAWFLLLLWELNKRSMAKDARFQKLRWSLTQDLLSWLQSAAFPELGDRLIATHYSWLMSLFLFDTAKSTNGGLSRAVRELVTLRVKPVADKLETNPMHEDDFLFLPALKYLISPDYRYDKPYLPVPTSATFACHYPGAVQVSLWAHSAQCARKDQRACDVVKKATQEFFQQTVAWKDDFACVSHWVPQFTWMTHWLSLGMP